MDVLPSFSEYVQEEQEELEDRLFLRISHLKSANKALYKENTELRSDVLDAEKRYQDDHREVFRLHDQITELQTQVGLVCDERDKLEQQVSDLMGIVSRLAEYRQDMNNPPEFNNLIFAANRAIEEYSQ